MAALVSIVTPSLNQGQFIEQTIKSVIEQDYVSIEHLVYDGGSTDDTLEVLERYADRVRVVVEPDGGQADAINRGIRAARGEIVAWLNSDDVYLPGAVSTAVDYLSAHPRCAMVYGQARYIDTGGRAICPYPTAAVSSLTAGCVVCQPAAFMRREAVAAVGFLDPGLRFCMDYDLWLRLAARYQIAYVEEMLACSRVHPEAKSVAERLPFMREIVHMTYNRLGKAPLFYLYAYANLLVTSKMGASARATMPRRLAAVALAGGLALRYNRRPTPTAVRQAVAFLRGPWPGPIVR